MSSETRTDRGAQFLLIGASLVVVIAGLRAASSILLPFVVSVFIAIVSLPLLFWLRSRKLPTVLAVLLTVLTDVAVLVGMGFMVGGSANQFVQELPKYQTRLEEMTKDQVDWLSEKGVPISNWKPLELVNPGALVNLARGTLQGVTAIVSNALLVLLTTTFILLEAASLPGKLKRALTDRAFDPGRFSKVTSEVRQYVAIKTIVSLLTGVFVTVWVGFVGVDFPVLWGLVAFVMNYIPNLGSILAAIPAVLLATVQLGPGRAALVGLGYVTVNLVLGSFVEPHFMGRRLGLSTLVVFLSLVFWGWVWGPLGMLLSVPLTMIVKILLENTEDLRWVAVMLGPSSEPATKS